jgi:dTDP-4-dehydrorhamnose reductase
MALRVANHLGLDTGLIEPVDASTFSQLGKRPQKTGFIIEKAKRILGYQPTEFNLALSQIF